MPALRLVAKHTYTVVASDEMDLGAILKMDAIDRFSIKIYDPARYPRIKKAKAPDIAPALAPAALPVALPNEAAESRNMAPALAPAAPPIALPDGAAERRGAVAASSLPLG